MGQGLEFDFWYQKEQWNSSEIWASSCVQGHRPTSAQPGLFLSCLPSTSQLWPTQTEPVLFPGLLAFTKSSWSEPQRNVLWMIALPQLNEFAEEQMTAGEAAPGEEVHGALSYALVPGLQAARQRPWAPCMEGGKGWQPSRHLPQRLPGSSCLYYSILGKHLENNQWLSPVMYAILSKMKVLDGSQWSDVKQGY